MDGGMIGRSPLANLNCPGARAYLVCTPDDRPPGARMATTRSTPSRPPVRKPVGRIRPAIDETKLLADALTFDGEQLPRRLDELRRHQPEQAAREGVELFPAWVNGALRL